MKTLLITFVCSVALGWSAFAQPAPAAAPTSSGPAASISPAASPTATAESEWQRKMEKRKHKGGINFTIGDEDSDLEHHSEDIPEAVLPIVALSLLAVFGTPVAIVAFIMYFGFSRNRMMHKTIRMMVEKGQEVPPALLAPPPPAVRQRSDMRRGVILSMIGIGMMLFFAAVNDWEGGAWTLGLIPFLIGVGYLLVWKLEGKKDNPPPLP